MRTSPVNRRCLELERLVSRGEIRYARADIECSLENKKQEDKKDGGQNELRATSLRQAQQHFRLVAAHPRKAKSSVEFGALDADCVPSRAEI